MMLECSAELRQWLQALIDGEISEEEFDQLSAHLKRNPAELDYYVRFMDIHAQLSLLEGDALSPLSIAQGKLVFEHASTALKQAAAPDHCDSSREEGAVSLPVRSPLIGFLDRLPAAIHPVRHPVWFLAAASSLTALFWMVVVLVILPRGERQAGRQPAPWAGAEIPFDAKIVRLQDVAWGRGAEHLRLGSILPVGRNWELEQGMVQLLFGDGAMVVLQGPARFQIDSAVAMQLEQGKLLAQAAGRAQGFTVDTPVVQVVDLGTEFGLEVRETKQEAEVQVFEGSVAVSSRDDMPQQYVLNSGEASLFGNSPRQGFYVKEKKMNRAVYVSLAALLALPVTENAGSVQTAQAMPITIDMVTVGNPGNAPDQVYTNNNPGSLQFGQVNYTYNISRNLVTNAQYTAFLNAVAATDTYSLYSTSMGSTTQGGIVRTGSSGNYVYTVKADVIGVGPGGSDYTYANKPVNYVSFYDALRFTNWLHNGQGAGDTETGAYTLLGGSATPTNGLAVTHNSGALFYLPTEDEWYKAAFYDPTLNTGSGGYHLYATQNSTVPNNNFPTSDTGNSANFLNGGNYTTGNMNYPLTDVGAYGLSSSYYGTYDQSGLLWEWNEQISTSFRVLRGGAWSSNPSDLPASRRSFDSPSSRVIRSNFRIASPFVDSVPPSVGAIPEPASGAMLGLGGLLVLNMARRRKRA